jgi:hypothetical protein
LEQIALHHGALDLRGEQLLLSEKLDVLAFSDLVEQGVQRRADLLLASSDALLPQFPRSVGEAGVASPSNRPPVIRAARILI